MCFNTNCVDLKPWEIQLQSEHSSLYVILNALETIHRVHTFTHKYFGGWESTGVLQRMMGIITVTSDECDTLRLTYMRHKKTRHRLDMHHEAVLKNLIMIKIWSTDNQNTYSIITSGYCLSEWIISSSILKFCTFRTSVCRWY